ncbi:hypothetical protein THAOC_26762 [Thalassiosira oceanica]|uniref:Uncharacterized protein n=1 Tax=Thalassiosira oceanica TaxID=159749 RepID=K0RY40_THAOC|nr:hypothetical protein THAOC_26762 [Thalassiosira oceanica]|eukprot:EJK53736.1 hypothetical protein THAOC_26762 [Thalassiosira oceanica]
MCYWSFALGGCASKTKMRAVNNLAGKGRAERRVSEAHPPRELWSRVARVRKRAARKKSQPARSQGLIVNKRSYRTGRLTRMAITFILVLLMGLVLAGHSACAFQMRRAPRHPPSTLHALPLPFGEKAEPQLPKDVKDAISKCRGAVQKALEDRLSRMDIEMPGEGGELDVHEATTLTPDFNVSRRKLRRREE